MKIPQLIIKLLKEIKNEFSNYEMVYKPSGSNKLQIDYHIMNAYRFQSDIDLMLILNFDKVSKDFLISTYKKVLNEIYDLVFKYQNEFDSVKKYPGMIRVKYKQRIYDLALIYMKNGKNYTIDNMFDTLKESENDQLVNKVKKEIKKYKFLKETLIFIKTLSSLYRVYDYRLPKGIFLTLLILEVYQDEKNLEWTIYKTIEKLYKLLIKNLDTEKIILQNVIMKIKFTQLERKAFASILKNFMEQKKVTNIYDK
ncbi:hypothetical protein [Mycoplasmopsis columbina]|uniref:hypothetical protein n=1 Tax=Mycoplasmopsis columbina TaxID=114881 RepID=UPI0004A6C444|nr:hypothetical protein [Mycoplasmopsis columbina]VEU76903.1 Uncharacterised protein [Mycoplasmopsis columbina]